MVARVGATAITQTAVSHWMNALAGEDYYAVSRRLTVPAGIVADPPNYHRCVTSLEVASAHAPAGAPKLTGIQLLNKCQQLYQALKTQATEYLVTAQWSIDSDRELGITTTEPEIQQAFNATRQANYPTQTELERYLTSRRLTLSDLLYEIRLSVLAQKALAKLETGGQQARTQYNEAWAKTTNKTTCTPGYIVQHCRQYKPSPTYPNSPPPSVLMEQITTITTGRCTDTTACNHQ